MVLCGGRSAPVCPGGPISAELVSEESSCYRVRGRGAERVGLKSFVSKAEGSANCEATEGAVGGWIQARTC